MSQLKYPCWQEAAQFVTFEGDDRTVIPGTVNKTRQAYMDYEQLICIKVKPSLN